MFHPSLPSSNPCFLKRRSILDSTVLCVLFSCLFVSSLHANPVFYRYKNAQGQLVLTQTLPAEFADKGYDVLNEKGRVTKTIPPALTPEEIKKRDEKLEQERLALIEKKKQAERDEELKQLFSEPNDAVRVLNRNFQDIQSVVEIKRSNMLSLKSQIIDEESRAADRQRKGYSVGEDTLAKLSSLKKDVENTQKDIAELYNKLDLTLIEFDEKIKRLETITQRKATDYTDVIVAIKKFLAEKH